MGGGLSGAERAIHWNGDVVVELPAGAVVLALSPGGEVQVARFGPRAWGIQAHPEADADVVRRWAEADREDHVSLGVDQDAVLADIAAAGPALEAHWRPLVACRDAPRWGGDDLERDLRAHRLPGRAGRRARGSSGSATPAGR